MRAQKNATKFLIFMQDNTNSDRTYYANEMGVTGKGK
jgi:hypothetical protein